LYPFSGPQIAKISEALRGNLTEKLTSYSVNVGSDQSLDHRLSLESSHSLEVPVSVLNVEPNAWE